jgi:hypothetical protein
MPARNVPEAMTTKNAERLHVRGQHGEACIVIRMAGVNYLDRPATTILAGWKRGMISM